MPALIRQSIYLIASFLFVLVWSLSPLSEDSAPALGFLVLIYLGFSLLKKRTGSKEESSPAVDPFSIAILNSIILILIFSTGGLASPFFFLLTLVAFGIAIVSLPDIVFVFVTGILIVFLPDLLSGNILENLVKLGSVLLVSPLAYFFGNEYRHREEIAERDEQVADAISQEASDVLSDPASQLTQEDREKLGAIIARSQTLKDQEE